MVRLARPRRARQAHQGPDADPPGHRRHAVHPQRGDPQLRHPARPQGPGEDDVVLRRPRRLPDRDRPGRLLRGRASSPGCSATSCAARRSRPARVRVAGRRRAVALGQSFPPPKGTPVVGEGSGLLVVSPADVVSGTPMAAAPAANAINVAIPATTAQVVGRPRLRSPTRAPANATPRLRPDRRRVAQPRARQPGDAAAGAARRRAAHDQAPARGRGRQPRARAAPTGSS